MLTVFQLRDASVQEIVHRMHHYKSDMSICRCCDNLRGRNVRSSSNSDTRSVSLGIAHQLSLQRHFLNAIELKTLARHR